MSQREGGTGGRERWAGEREWGREGGGAKKVSDGFTRSTERRRERDGRGANEQRGERSRGAEVKKSAGVRLKFRRFLCAAFEQGPSFAEGRTSSSLLDSYQTTRRKGGGDPAAYVQSLGKTNIYSICLLRGRKVARGRGAAFGARARQRPRPLLRQKL